VHGDALCLCRALPDTIELADDALVEQAVAHAQVVVRRGRARARRLPFVACVHLRQPRRRVLVVRLPILGHQVVGRR